MQLAQLRLFAVPLALTATPPSAPSPSAPSPDGACPMTAPFVGAVYRMFLSNGQQVETVTITQRNGNEATATGDAHKGDLVWTISGASVYTAHGPPIICLGAFGLS